MNGMFQTIRNAWKIVDLRKKILFTILILLIHRIGSVIPVPGIAADEFAKLISSGGQLFGFLDTIAGGAFKNASIFAMSITPYVNASIIMTLLQVAIPALERLSKEGPEGRKKIQQIVRYATVGLGFFQASMLYLGMRGAMYDGGSLIGYITVTLTFTAGTAFLMWLGEQITERGIGNGISLIIFVGIISRAPAGATAIANLWGTSVPANAIGVLEIALVLIVFIGVVAAVIWVQEAERRIPIQYAKRVVGRKMYGGQSTHLPIKVNMSGVLPIIFAMSIMAFPSTIINLAFPNTQSQFLQYISNMQGTWVYMLLYALLIILFTFFYSVIQMNPIEISNNLKKNGGFIPGIRPGKPTAVFIQNVINRVTWFGAFFLAFITLFPSLMGIAFSIQGIWFGGTALLILVGVALDTVKQIESQMLMRHYKGFLE